MVDAQGLPVDLATLTASIGQTTGGKVGVAVLPLRGSASFTAGPAQLGAAWSTMKIPVIMARYRLAQASGEAASGLTERVRAGITRSDNDAVMSLFREIEARTGGLRDASRYVQQVLRDAGDGDTVVNTNDSPEGFSTFGQTQWSLLAGARFFRALALGQLEPRDASGLMLEMMAQVVPEQSWGLGRVDFGDAKVYLKGGWGPEPSGGHLVRQFGFVVRPQRRGLVIGMMARPADGTFESGVALIDQLARAVSAASSPVRPEAFERD